MVTIQDIADKTGVSISTVSRALSGSTKISQKTRERIQKSAKELGYTPNFSAQNLNRVESNIVGVVFPPKSANVNGNDFALQTLFGINKQLKHRQYLLAMATGDSWSEVYDDVKMMVEAGRIRRFILLYTVENDPISQLLFENEAKEVMIGEPQAKGETLYVDNYNMQAGSEATDMLVKHYGLKMPVFIRTDEDWRYEVNREMGFRQACPHGLELRLGATYAEQKLQLEKFFEAHQDVDGIVASDDKLGFMAQSQAEAHLATHPKLPTMGFNNSEYAEIGGKHFHSVDVLPRVLGEEAVRLLFNDLLEESERTRSTVVVVPYQLPIIP
ncbi:MAG: LacI family DNA-binding transcriptional regulator [Lactobacillaceae bacterium]|jgi:DNA-binding LacI/PurR family transcriptional regulator|nr:LacI family DNA-binding transcriptional regulator [Lactobacillaceae bacterium]